MITPPVLDFSSGFPILLEVFTKSSLALGASLCVNGLLRGKSADLRRLALSASIGAMLIAAIALPALPRWKAAMPAWARVPSPPISPIIDYGSGPLGSSAQLQGASTAPSARPRHVGNGLPVIPSLWIAGTVILLLRFLVQLRNLRRLRLASRAAGRLSGRVTLLENEIIGAPVTWGIFRPVILVPAGFVQLPGESRSQALRHEMAHIENHDFALRILAEIARAAIWFQPLIWIVRLRLREEQELACDNRVVAADGKPSAYAKLLLDWDAGLVASDSSIALGMASRSCLRRRLYALLDPETNRGAVSRFTTLGTGLLALTAALPLAAFNFAPAAAPPAARQPVAAPFMTAPQPTTPLSQPVALARAQAKPAPPHDAQPQTAEQQAPTQLPPDDPQLVFEVASLKHGPPFDYSVGGHGGPGAGDPTRWSVENYPISSLLHIAYGIASYQLSGPSWLDDERFTIEAKLAEGTTKEQLGMMLRNLLIERFRLSAHFEKRDVDGYRLVPAKSGPKLTPSSGDPNLDENQSEAAAPYKWTTDKDGYPELPPGRQYSMAMGYGRARWRFGDESMDAFVKILGDWMRHPVVNATGLAGKYDFTFSWATDDPKAGADPAPNIFEAFQEQLGLKLESRRISVDTVVIDRIFRKPSEN
jgi:uncharacterized protein (TIGR03435 family)